MEKKRDDKSKNVVFVFELTPAIRIFPHKPDYTRAGPQLLGLIEHESRIPKRFHQTLKWFHTEEGNANKHGIAYEHTLMIKTIPFLTRLERRQPYLSR